MKWAQDIKVYEPRGTELFSSTEMFSVLFRVCNFNAGPTLISGATLILVDLWKCPLPTAEWIRFKRVSLWCSLTCEEDRDGYSPGKEENHAGDEEHFAVVVPVAAVNASIVVIVAVLRVTTDQRMLAASEEK